MCTDVLDRQIQQGVGGRVEKKFREDFKVFVFVDRCSVNFVALCSVVRCYFFTKPHVRTFFTITLFL